MFIDYLTLLLANMAAGLAVYGWFLLRGICAEDNKAWAPAFAVPGLIALVFGGIITVTWPLPGVHNIMYGEMSVLLGVVFLAAAWALARGWSLSPLSIVTLLTGLWPILIGQQIMAMKMLGAGSTLVGLGFIATGAAGSLLGVVLCVKKAPLFRYAVAALALATALFWAATACKSYRGHLASKDFKAYKSALQKQATAPQPCTCVMPAASQPGK